MSADLIHVLNDCGVNTIFVAGYGLKMPSKYFENIFPQHAIPEWDADFRQSFFANLPTKCKELLPQRMITEHGNNFYQIGRRFQNKYRDIALILPVGPHQAKLHREPYHLFGTLGDKTDNNGVRHRFGSVTFKTVPDFNDPVSDLVITKRVFYAVWTNHSFS
jgi:hypothetical protein